MLIPIDLKYLSRAPCLDSFHLEWTVGLLSGNLAFLALVGIRICLSLEGPTLVIGEDNLLRDLWIRV